MEHGFCGLRHERAGQVLPTELETLNAIHLATALLWREMEYRNLLMATDDAALAVAAQAHGFKMLGV